MKKKDLVISAKYQLLIQILLLLLKVGDLFSSTINCNITRKNKDASCRQRV